MKYIALFVSIAAVVVAGCNNINEVGDGLPTNRGTSRMFAGSSREQVFTTARRVLSQYYSVSSADPITGVIKTRPKEIAAAKDRLLGNSPARQIATAQVQSEDGGVIVQVLVVQQRQGTEIIKTVGYSQERYNYSGDPGRVTPADEGAATTQQQNETWEFEKELKDVENRILDDIAMKLRCKACLNKSKPAKAAGFFYALLTLGDIGAIISQPPQVVFIDADRRR